MDNYPKNQNKTTANQKSKQTVLVVAVLVIIVVVGFGLLTYLNRPVTGVVTAVSSAYISIRPSGSSISTTYNITSTTMMGLPKSAGGGEPQEFNIKDIHIGETVVINPGTNGQAQAITVNP